MNSKYDNYLTLLPGCYVVKGARRAVLINIQNEHFDIVPLELTMLLLEGYNLEHYYAIYSRENWPALDSYAEFLQTNNYARLSSAPGKDPNIRLEWDAPFRITNAIIDFHSEYKSGYMARLKELGDIGCQALQLRFLHQENMLTIEPVVAAISNIQKFAGLSLVMHWEAAKLYTEEEQTDLVIRYPLINELIFYNAPQNAFTEHKKYRFKTLSTQQKIEVQSCGVVQPLYFGASITMFTESLRHNSCLNRKIGIDSKGYIRNCPSMPEHFGHISDTSLQEAIDKPGFKKYWHLTKDLIHTCRDCEFRHICTDCRAYLEEPGDDYSKPLKCGYDPYTCTWADWSTHPMKQKAMAFYGLKGTTGISTGHGSI